MMVMMGSCPNTQAVSGELALASGAVTFEFFAGHRVFRALPRDVLKSVVTQILERRYRRNEEIYQAGDPPLCTFLVSMGLVSLTEMDSRGTVFATQICSAGDVFGLATAVFGVRQGISATTLVDSRIYLVANDTFRKLYRRFPAFAHAVAYEFYSKLRRTEQSVLASRTPVSARIATFLLESVDRTNANSHPPAFDLTFSHQQLALLLGTTRETVNRMFSRLSRASVIATTGKQVRILKADALRSLASSSPSSS
jgi:CRP-like cAMP-binding protein